MKPSPKPAKPGFKIGEPAPAWSGAYRHLSFGMPGDEKPDDKDHQERVDDIVREALAPRVTDNGVRKDRWGKGNTVNAIIGGLIDRDRAISTDRFRELLEKVKHQTLLDLYNQLFPSNDPREGITPENYDIQDLEEPAA